MQPKPIRLFLLSAFSFQGGIERFNRAFLYAINQQKNLININTYVLHDKATEPNAYAPKASLTAFKGNKWFFLFLSILQIFRNESWIIGHLNLAILGYIRKLVLPSRPLVLICHGVEVFRPVSSFFQKKVLQKADIILAVSSYTKSELMTKQSVSEDKILVFPNTIDPFFKYPSKFIKPQYLLDRYDIQKNDKILLTVSRINSWEGYKGYDHVIRTIPILLRSGFRVKYLICGKSDMIEEKRIRELIQEYGVQNEFILTGYVKEEELIDHYLSSDIFVMPSKGEGFGIVFLEAMACGTNVIAGNKDGSIEALQFGKLGTLVDPDNLEELQQAIADRLINSEDPHLIQQRMLNYFSFEKYKERTKNLLEIMNSKS